MVRSYAIGDIHGHLDSLVQVHRWVEEDQRRYGPGGETVHVGDLVDRGPDSAGVINLLIDGIKDGKPWVVLKGNHDRLMSYYLGQPSRKDPCLRPEYNWLSKAIGGATTLASYGVAVTDGDDPATIHPHAIAAVPSHHRRFLEGLPLIHQSNGVAFVHAGVKPRVALQDQAEDDLVWIRAEFHNYRGDHGRLIVHGHTPIKTVRHYGNRINIDTGVAFGGPLTVIVIEDGKVWNLQENGRTILLPD